jgi:hypothetical protein
MSQDEEQPFAPPRDPTNVEDKALDPSPPPPPAPPEPRDPTNPNSAGLQDPEQKAEA